MSKHAPTIPSMGSCPDCGKTRYPSRAIAKKARRRKHPNAVGMKVYACGDFWHYGSPALQPVEAADGQPTCRTPNKPHHPTELSAHKDAQLRVRRHQLPSDHRIYECPCGDGWCIARPRRDDTWRASA